MDLIAKVVVTLNTKVGSIEIKVEIATFGILMEVFGIPTIPSLDEQVMLPLEEPLDHTLDTMLP